MVGLRKDDGYLVKRNKEMINTFVISSLSFISRRGGDVKSESVSRSVMSDAL